MRRMIALLFFVFVAAFAATANAQCFGGGELSRVLAGPCVERVIREGYAPVDFAINNIGPYAAYGLSPYGGGRQTAYNVVTGAIMGAGAGAALDYRHPGRGAAIGAVAGGGLAAGLSLLINRRRGEYVGYTPDGGLTNQEVIFAKSKPQKPLDCRKITNKNRQACEAAVAEIANQRQLAERQACLDQLSSSYWRLRNGSDRFTFYPTVGDQPMTVCGETVVLRPLQTVRIFPPDGQIGGISSGASALGEMKGFEATVQPVNQPGFIGFVLLAPSVPEREE